MPSVAANEKLSILEPSNILQALTRIDVNVVISAEGNVCSGKKNTYNNIVHGFRQR